MTEQISNQRATKGRKKDKDKRNEQISKERKKGRTDERKTDIKKGLQKEQTINKTNS